MILSIGGDGSGEADDDVSELDDRVSSDLECNGSHQLPSLCVRTHSLSPGGAGPSSDEIHGVPSNRMHNSSA